MNPLVVVSGLLLVGLALFSRTSMAGGSGSNSSYIIKAERMSESELDLIFQKYGRQYGVDWTLLKAHAMAESALKVDAFNAADPSVGLMQILCTGYDTGECRNKFNIQDWPPFSADELFDADYNVKIGAQIVAWNQKQYGYRKGIAVYNNWSARNQAEPFSNQSYVDRVVRFHKQVNGK